ncbi:hypothetical protein O3M35_012143 [Rhynocoris fuscipes]|uniref:Ima1 N-terminal domain-containing protein n=1 Tax=Rhynocoris fuscipes TaxID=488301 RepID=A0AAW1CSL4_9HEMI
MDGILICLAFSAFTILLIFIRDCILWIRNKIPKRVQCWFCHSKTTVQYSISNSWYCSNCDQYNGFTKSGDYNKVVDNQYDEKLNYSVTSIGRTSDAWKSTNRLCEKCNHNQELKVQQLASFVPLNENNYEIEIEHYRAQLEKCYKLCPNCEALLSKIFVNERNTFSIPRRLATSLIIKPEVTGFGRFILYMNLFLSLILSISAYTKLEGVPAIISEFIDNYDCNTVLKYMKPAYLFILGSICNILGWVNTRSSGLLLNALSWLIVLTLRVFAHNYKHYIIALQALSGIISCAVSVICLTSKRRTFKESFPNKIFDGKKFNNHQTSFVQSSYSTESLPKVNLNEDDDLNLNISQFSNKTYKINKDCSTSPYKTPTSSARVIKPSKNWSEAINTGIRGLNLGNNITNNLSSSSFSRNLSQKRTENNLSSSNEGVWWVNGLKNRKLPQKNLSQTNIRPPSTSSSGYSEIAEDLVDDCASCTGNSPVCRHHCHLSPSQVEVTCYYAAAYFQRLLSPTPSPQQSQIYQRTSSTPNTSLQQTQPLPIYDPFSYIYSLPIIALIVSNVALLWTVYYQQHIKV